MLRTCSLEEAMISATRCPQDELSVLISSLPKLHQLLRDLLTSTKYDFDLWASIRHEYMRVEEYDQGRIVGDLFDGDVFEILHDRCEKHDIGLRRSASARGELGTTWGLIAPKLESALECISVAKEEDTVGGFHRNSILRSSLPEVDLDMHYKFLVRFMSDP